MKGKWKVTSNYNGETKYYQVYRLRDINEVDHSGNREKGSGIIDGKEEAIKVASWLNEKEGEGNEG